MNEVDSRPTAVDPGKDGSVRITISCHYKDNFAYRYFLAISSDVTVTIGESGYLVTTNARSLVVK